MRPIVADERPRFLTDENFDIRITLGLRQRYPDIDLVTIQEAQQLHILDPELLHFAQTLNRIVLSHDVNTLSAHFYTFLDQLDSDEHSPGICLVAQKAPIGSAIMWIAEVWGASRHDEWRNQIIWLPQ